MTVKQLAQKAKRKQQQRCDEARRLIFQARQLLSRDAPQGMYTDRFCRKLDKWLKE
jgi:hypothetical protein